jgi:hypothetical protein
MKLRYKIKENSWIARIAAWKLRSDNVAIVIGSTIHLHNTSRESFLMNKRWLRHELKHIQQFHEYGFFPFIFKYLLETIRNGYYNNRFEKEARIAENSTL